ncbi:hypothetical protein TWF718_006990 [Orbilia javanica]|uniref:Uncharacterized protein n=1 Tax=Orbilia javanica TaxID=47235 RepID=A0AAN8NV96_9PEZI
MASRTVLHHAAIKITPPTRTLRESREIYRSLRKFGEVDFYRSLRHETSTLETKDDAIVLFRDATALREAFEASPINISISAAQPSPIPPSNLSAVSASAGPPPTSKFTIEISKREHNHETRIIDQLFTIPHSIVQETPPGTSIGLNSKPDISRAPDANEYRKNLVRATGGGWKSWRLEMKQAGIPTWDSIKPTSDIVIEAPSETGTPRLRANSVSWGWPSDASDTGARDTAQSVIPKSISSTISNPTPLPLDPTLQPFRRQRQSQPGAAYSSPSTMRGPTGWWRGALHAGNQSFHPPSQQDQPRDPSTMKSSSQTPLGPISSWLPSQNESEGRAAPHITDPKPTPLARSGESRGKIDDIAETEPPQASSNGGLLPIRERQQTIKMDSKNSTERIPAQGPPQIHETRILEQTNTASISVRDLPSDAEEVLKEWSPDKANTSADARTDQKILSEGALSEQADQSKPQHTEATTKKEPAAARKKWWSLPWQN